MDHWIVLIFVGPCPIRVTPSVCATWCRDCRPADCDCVSWGVRAHELVCIIILDCRLLVVDVRVHFVRQANWQRMRRTADICGGGVRREAKMATYEIVVFALLALAIVYGTRVPRSDVECQQICTDNFEPVCATDDSSFIKLGNACQLGVNNCLRENEGEKPLIGTDMDWCNTEYVDDLRDKLRNIDRPECEKPCAFIYEPLCISNGEYRSVVSNKCEMEYFNCKTATSDDPTPFKELRQGTC